MAIPLINGVQHSWASIRIPLLGRTVVGVVAIDYGMDHAKENHYGQGDEPIYRSYGNKTYKASITLTQYEVIGLQQAALGAGITSIPPFDFPVVYLPMGNTTQVTDVVQQAEFVNNVREWKQGDTKQDIKLDLIIGGVKFHSL